MWSKTNKAYVKDNLNFILESILHRYKINSNGIYEHSLKNHPFFPSYLSLKYALKKCGINSCVVSTNIEDLTKMPLPCVVRLDIDGGVFAYVEDIAENAVTFKTGANKFRTEQTIFLERFWDGTVMLFDEDYEPLVKPRWQDLVRTWFNAKSKYLLIILIGVLIAKFSFTQFKVYSVWDFLFLLNNIAGVCICALFIIQESNKKHNLINRVCHSSKHKNRDCSSILDSKDARFMGLFKWSDFGMIYFLTMCGFLLFFEHNLSNIILVLLSFISSMYIPYSLLYQKYISKKWCMLCLIIQSILFINLIISVLIVSQSNFLDTTGIPNLSSIFFIITWGVFVVLAYSVFKLSYDKILSHSSIERKYRSLKNHDGVISILLNEQQHISTNELPKIVLSPNGSDTITVIFNTTCNPCLNEVRKLLKIIESKNDTAFEFIFFLDRSDLQSVNIAYSLLNYYTIDNSNFFNLFKKYVEHFPKSASILSQQVKKLSSNDIKTFDDIISTQETWCRLNNIASTPQIFFNYQHLPEMYDINDLDYMCE